MEDDVKLNRAAVLSAGAATAIGAVLAAAGCGGAKNSSTTSADAKPSPMGTEATHPIHMYARFQLPSGTQPGTVPSTATACTIVICDQATPPVVPNGAHKFLELAGSADVDDGSCASTNTPFAQSMLIYFT